MARIRFHFHADRARDHHVWQTRISVVHLVSKSPPPPPFLPQEHCKCTALKMQLHRVLCATEIGAARARQ